MFRSTRRKVLQTLGVTGAAGSLAGCPAAPQSDTDPTPQVDGMPKEVDRVASDPTDVPDPIDRDQPKTHDITLQAQEVIAPIEEGNTFHFMTFDGQVPGPMIRVRQGDTVNLTFENLKSSNLPHNVDFHAVYGTGGGSEATDANPGETNTVKFQARYPGAFIYHCAVPNLDYHISSGMFGMIVVEPEDGFPEVDREFYLGQHEIYTQQHHGAEGRLNFDIEGMMNEEPTYVLFNGEKYPYIPDKYGSLEAETGETVRVFLVVGGPNYSSNFHPIGNIWKRAYRDGAVVDSPERYVQTMKVPPGSCMIGTMDLPVPERIYLVDHALSRYARRGLGAYLDITGEERPDIYDPSPDMDASEDEEGPFY
ncbi:copper-containing nitrite reductase [Haloplanus aerogenes]|uniref:Copper-containing nitrite reductase n=1 Tax=Haloplanus aerogenes TaxID=660522 RepID=A0A3G8QWW5_9EURY|nr:copper-containing nitrite reductase [Haloplanus aerogenes]AZH25982.1 nitrite reductase, copper-containing [Haloplanus aerogenes]RMB11680.1 nitrite reductase (NO-forming) [Haloplanus aerogenes]